MTECVEHAAVARIADFAELRPIVLAIVVVTVMYLGFVLAPLLGGVALGSLAAAAVVLTSGYSFMYLQGLPAAMVLITPLLAAASFTLYSGRNREDAGKLGREAISLSLFLAACLIYPAYAFIVLPLALLEFGFSLSKTFINRLKNLISTLGFYFGASLVYYALVKLMVFFVARATGELPDLGAYEVTMRLEPSALLHQLKTAAIYFVYMPPFDFSAPNGSSVVILVLFSGGLGWLTCRAQSQRRYSVFWVSLLLLLICAVVLFGSISPWVFSSTSDVGARHILPWNLFLCAAAVGLLSLLLQRNSTTRKLASAILLLTVLLPMAWIQNRQSKLETVATNLEITLMREALSKWIDIKGWENARYLLIVVPTAARSPNIESAVNPGYGNNNAVLASSQNPVVVPWMVNALLRERADYPGIECNIVKTIRPVRTNG